VDDHDQVWVSEWAGNAVYRFDPSNEKFERFDFPRAGTNIRQILGRQGEVWLPESGTETISVIRTA
jgi:virginiamycin B lyase